MPRLTLHSKECVVNLPILSQPLYTSYINLDPPNKQREDYSKPVIEAPATSTEPPPGLIGVSNFRVVSWQFRTQYTNSAWIRTECGGREQPPARQFAIQI